MFEHIETGSVDLTVLQGGDQRLLVHYRATPGVNEDGGRFHFGKLRLTEQMVSLFAQGQDQADKVSLLQQGIEIAIAGIKAVRNYGEAFRSRNVILLCAQYFAWSIGVYGFVLWLPSIIRSGGENMGMVEVGWLSSVPYLAATIAMIVVSWASDKLQNRKLFVWPLLLIGGLAFIGSWAVGANHFWVSYTLLVVAGAAMYAPYGPFFAIIPEMLPRNVAGGAMALINSMGALGSFCGSWFVGYLNGATGSPAASYIFMGVALFASVWLTLIVKPANNQNLPLGAHHA